MNLSDEVYKVKDGERICKMIVTKHERAEWNEVDVPEETKSGKRGIGHTGRE